MTQVAANLRRLRESAELSQQALGKAAGLSSAHVSHIESGKIPNPNTGTLQKLADALGVSMAELFKDDPTEAGGDSAA